MYNISKEVAKAFRAERAIARISVELVSGDALEEITEHNIETLIIERSAVSGNVIEIGAARLFELNLRLNNADGVFDNVQFDGSHLRVRTGVNTKSGVELVPMGLFIVDGHEEDNDDIVLTAFDYMVKFDKSADFSGVVFPTTPARLIRYACEKCGVDPSRLDFSNLSNADYVIEKPPESAVTWRSVLMWCCQILGACAFMDAEGYLIVKWYTDTGEKLTASDRFNHKLFLKDVAVNGVEIVTDDAIYSAGSNEGFIFSIEGNELITHDFDILASNLGAALIGFTHRPFSASTLSLPHIFPLDMMTYVTPNGEEVAVCVSSYKFTLNSRTELKGVGESETTSGFSTLDPLTEKQKAVIAAALRKSEDKSREEISEAEASLIRLNEVIGNALGLYVVTVEESNGAKQIYFCDKPTLEESGLIYVFNGGGVAWSHKWLGSNEATVWNYGISRDGNAVLNYLTLNKLNAEQINVSEIVGAINKSTGDTSLIIQGDHISIDGKVLESYLSEYTSEQVSDALESYTENTLKNELKSYATSSEVSTTISTYVSNALEGYAKSSELDVFLTSEEFTVTLTNYATKTAESKSFSYSLTASGFKINASGETVLVADEYGLEVVGKIKANEGEIAGLEIVSDVELDDSGNVTSATRSLKNKSNTFYIKVEEDENGNATATEVLITDLLCDIIKANNSQNVIDLCYEGTTYDVTAKLTYSSTLTSTITGTPTGLNWIKRTITLNIELSRVLLSDKKVTIDWGVASLSELERNANTSTITIPKGTSGTYSVQKNYFNYYGLNIPANYARFTESNSDTLTFKTAEETSKMIKITAGGVIPDATNAQDFGHDDRVWKSGYFKDLYITNSAKIGDNAVAAPYLRSSTTVTIGVSSGNTVSSSTFTADGDASAYYLKIGAVEIMNVVYTGEIKEDKWYFFNTQFSTIYSVQVTARGASDASLSGNTHGACMCAYWNSGEQVFVGCDHHSSANGFIVTVIGIR